MEARGSGKVRHRRRNVLIGLAIAAALPHVIARIEAMRLKRKPDPEAGEVISEPLGEKERYVEGYDGTRLYTEELGKGPALVLIHGVFCNTDMWHYQKKALSKKFRVICYEQRGHRRSEAPENADYSFKALARDLHCVLEECAPGEPVVLAGHSLGGMAILEYSTMFPDELGKRVKGVALVDSANVPLSSCMAGGFTLNVIRKPLVEPFLSWAVRHPELSDRVKTAVTRTSLFLVAVHRLGYGSDASLTQMEYISEMACKTTMKGASLALLGLARSDEVIPLDALASSGIPVLLWVGEKDKLALPRIDRQMSEELPGCELHIIEDTGHASYIEDYRHFNSVFEEFAVKAFKRGG